MFKFILDYERKCYIIKALQVLKTDISSYFDNLDYETAIIEFFKWINQIHPVLRHVLIYFEKRMIIYNSHGLFFNRTIQTIGSKQGGYLSILITGLYFTMFLKQIQQKQYSLNTPAGSIWLSSYIDDAIFYHTKTSILLNVVL